MYERAVLVKGRNADCCPHARFSLGYLATAPGTPLRSSGQSSEVTVTERKNQHRFRFRPAAVLLFHVPFLLKYSEMVHT
jgi:hypothetical protein